MPGTGVEIMPCAGDAATKTNSANGMRKNFRIVIIMFRIDRFANRLPNISIEWRGFAPAANIAVN